MVATNIYELMKILNGTHADPHTVLGLHEIAVDGKAKSVVRVFCPVAARVEIFNPEKPSWCHELELEHVDGFFSKIIPKRKHFHYKLRLTSRDGHIWEIYDPYTFPPGISEMDLYLFGNGTHYEIYNKLGATFTQIDGIDGVLFGVWAPNAKRISVVGDFNLWNGLRHPMRSLGSSGVWELFVPGLKNYDKYKFELNSHLGGLFYKSDPYAFFSELRPGTASMVYDISKYEWGDGEWLENRQRHSPLDGPMNIYELHAGSWRKAAHDNWRFLSWPELTKSLIPYVKEMGYTHIELMPIMEHPFDGSWGYQVTGYYAATSRYGSPCEFKEFVDTCHLNGIGVLMDWVPAHFPKDAHGLAWFDGSRLYEHEDPRQGEHPEWGTLVFNYGRSEVKNFLIANALFWINEYHIDGLRVDAVASMLYLDYAKEGGNWVANKYGGRENIDAVEFMKHMNSVLLGAHPHVLLIAEESTSWEGVTRPAQYNGLGFSLKWNMGWMNDFLEYMGMDSHFRKYHHNNLTFSMVYAYSEKYILVLSHDEVVHGKKSLVDKMPGDVWQKLANLRAAYGFMMGHPGKKLLFMGGEFGQFVEWSEERELDWFLLDWFAHHAQMHQFVKELNHLYLRERALWQYDFDGRGFAWLNPDDGERSIYSFYRVEEAPERDYARSYVIFICNFTPVPHMDFRVGVPECRDYREILNSDDERFGGSGIINPGALHSHRHLCDGREFSVGLKLPALAVVALKG